MSVEQIGVMNTFGEIVAVVALDELVATGDNHTIHLINNGTIGSVSYELVIENDDQLVKKIQMAHDLVTA